MAQHTHARRAFLEGFRAILPLWAGAVPIGISYALAARAAGLHPLETVLLSLTVSSAAAQLSAVSLVEQHASAALVLLTTGVLLAHQLLFGFALGRLLPLTRPRRLAAAFFMNDGPYGVAAAHPRPSLALLLGAELSMYLVWNAATAAGVLVGGWLPNLASLGLDLVVPLLFLALLLPQLGSRATALTALAAGLAALGLAAVVPASVAVLGAVAASVAGPWLAAEVAARRRAAP